MQSWGQFSQGMHLGFCAANPGLIPGRVSGQASESPHVSRAHCGHFSNVSIFGNITKNSNVNISIFVTLPKMVGENGVTWPLLHETKILKEISGVFTNFSMGGGLTIICCLRRVKKQYWRNLWCIWRARKFCVPSAKFLAGVQSRRFAKYSPCLSQVRHKCRVNGV